MSSNLKNFSSCQAFLSYSSRCYKACCNFWMRRRSYSLLGLSSKSCLSSSYSSCMSRILCLFSSIILANYFFISWVHSICSFTIPWILRYCCLFSYSSLNDLMHTCRSIQSLCDLFPKRWPSSVPLSFDSA